MQKICQKCYVKNKEKGRKSWFIVKSVTVQNAVRERTYPESRYCVTIVMVQQFTVLIAKNVLTAILMKMIDCDAQRKHVIQIIMYKLRRR